MYLMNDATSKYSVKLAKFVSIFWVSQPNGN